MVIVLFKFVPNTSFRNKAENTLNFFSRIKRVNKRKIYLLFLIMFTIYSLYIMWITLITYMPLYYTGANITLINVGTIMLFFGMLGGAGGLFSGFLFDRFKKGSLIIQIGFVLAAPILFFTFRTTGLISIILFVTGGFFLISIQPVCIRMTQDLLPGNMSLASSLILGFSPGIAAITMIFLGKAADIIGIVALINYEIILIIFTILMLFSFPLAERSLRDEKNNP